jgi:uncharacterized protein (DUF2062 family)
MVEYTKSIYFTKLLKIANIQPFILGSGRYAGNMISLERIINFFKKIVLTERSPKKLAIAFCVGVFIAFSPFFGFHTIMTIFAAWYFHLNFAVIYSAAHIFNNPWTMVPLYMSDYIVGLKIFALLGLDPHAWANPCWANWLNGKLTYYIGLPKLSLWAFVIGGNVLGLAVSLALYPFIIRIFRRILAHSEEKRP